MTLREFRPKSKLFRVGFAPNNKVVLIVLKVVYYQLMEVEEMMPRKAVKQLRHCLEEGSIVPTKHFRDELSNEHILFEDAWTVLRYGQIYDPPEEDMRSGEWKYRIEGYEPGGKWIVIVFCFKRLDQAWLITIFSVTARRKKK